METKKRSPNYSNREKSLLLEIITEFKNIIENKKTDAVTWRNKDESWVTITDIFNSRSVENIYRSKESLRKYYENIKKSLRKQVAEDKKEINLTGGGIPKKGEDDKWKEMILGIVNHKTVYGLANNFDGDSKNQGHTSQSPSSQHGIETVPDNDEHSYALHTEELDDEINPPIVTSPVTHNGHKKVNVTQLRQPRDSALQHTWTRRRRPAIHQHSSQLTEEYSQLANVKMSFYREEQENIKRRREREEEAHELLTKKLKLEIEKSQLEIKKTKLKIKKLETQN